MLIYFLSQHKKKFICLGQEMCYLRLCKESNEEAEAHGNMIFKMQEKRKKEMI